MHVNLVGTDSQECNKKSNKIFKDPLSAFGKTDDILIVGSLKKNSCNIEINVN